MSSAKSKKNEGVMLAKRYSVSGGCHLRQNEITVRNKYYDLKRQPRPLTDRLLNFCNGLVECAG